MVEYSKFRNKNRGYMKLEVWQKSIELLRLISKIVYSEIKIDFKLRAQSVDAAQSISSNVAEGYCRRSIHEYIQFLYVALGSMGETLTRAIGLLEIGKITNEQFTQIDVLHYEVENKLLKLVESLEKKRDSGGWINKISDELEEYHILGSQNSSTP